MIDINKSEYSLTNGIKNTVVLIMLNKIQKIVATIIGKCIAHRILVFELL